MRSRFVEVVGTMNWGKFMVAQFDEEEWGRASTVDGRPLVGSRGWSERHALVLDLQTGEGALLWPHPNGMPSSDLNKHKIWVCPMFEPFLEWLYRQDLTDIMVLPDRVDLLDAPASMHGYRREGPINDDE